MTQDQQTILENAEKIREVISQQQGSELSQAEFARRIKVDKSVYSKLVNGGAYTGNIATQCSKIRKGCIALQRALKNPVVAKSNGWIKFEEFTLLENAISICQANAKTNHEAKMIFVTGGSGFGKTQMSRELVDRFGAVRVVGREAWRGSFAAPLSALCRAFIVPEGQTARMEDDLVAALQISGGNTLVLDEVEGFSSRFMNLLRLISNSTPTVIVVFATPEFHSRLIKLANSSRPGASEARQMLRRVAAQVSLDVISSGMVMKFLPSLTKSEAEQIALAAQRSRGLDLVSQVCRKVSEGASIEGAIAEFNATVGVL